MKNTGFREKNRDKITSPEQLGDYIRVMNPRAWMVLLAVVFLFISGFVWSATASLESLIPVEGVIYKEHVIAYMDPDTAGQIKAGMTVKINGKAMGSVEAVGKEPVRREEAGIEFLSDYERETKLGDWNTEILIEADITGQDGDRVSCFIVSEERKPISFFGA